MDEGKIIFYDSKTMKVLNDEIAQKMETHENNNQFGSVSIVNSKYVKIENGYIVERFTQEDIKKMQEAEEEREQDIFLNHLNTAVNLRRYEEAHRISTSPAYNGSRPAQKQTVQRTRRKKLTFGQKLVIVIDNIIKENAKRKSATAQKHSTKRNRSSKKTFNQAVAIAAVVVILGSAAGIGYGVNELTDYSKYRQSHADVREATAILLDDNLEDKYQPNILDQNTSYDHINSINWYENYDISEDVLALPDVTFDANLYLVYALMGNNADNAYNNNFDDVISYISQNATQEANPNAYLKCSGCSSLSDFLIKNGIIDEKGAPNMDAFKKYGREATIRYAPLLKKLANEKLNAIIESVEEEEITKGGR